MFFFFLFECVLELAGMDHGNYLAMEGGNIAVVQVQDTVASLKINHVRLTSGAIRQEHLFSLKFY